VATPNGHKVHIMLEECGLPYRAHPVDIGAGDQFKPEFLAISPNNKIPAIVDPEGPDGQPISLFESGAILLYLAGKTGRFLPADTRGKYEVLQWLMFQMGGVGPMLGQAHHFRIYAPEKIPYAIERYTNEAKRLYGVMNKRLAKSRYLGGAGLQHRRHRRLSLAAQLEEPGHRLERLPAPQGLVRRDRRPPRSQARRGGAGRPAQAHHGRQGARDPFWQAAGRAALNPRPRPAS
jgi:glutathione S-transferase